MSVADLSRKAGTGSESSEFSCPHYAPPPGSKRCEHYQDGGTCARPDFFLCTEWEKRNRHRLPPIQPPGEARQGTEVGVVADDERRSPAAATDLFGNPAPELVQQREEHRTEKAGLPLAAHPARADAPDERPPLRGLTDDDIASFKDLKAEVCLRSEAFGDVWLVPEYTGGDRKEITPEHAATICRVLDAFPGSQVVSFEKPPETDKEAEPRSASGCGSRTTSMWSSCGTSRPRPRPAAGPMPRGSMGPMSRVGASPRSGDERPGTTAGYGRSVGGYEVVRKRPNRLARGEAPSGPGRPPTGPLRRRAGPANVPAGPGRRSVGPEMARKVERAWPARA